MTKKSRKAAYLGEDFRSTRSPIVLWCLNQCRQWLSFFVCERKAQVQHGTWQTKKNVITGFCIIKFLGFFGAKFLRREFFCWKKWRVVFFQTKISLKCSRKSLVSFFRPTIFRSFFSGSKFVGHYFQVQNL
jgi:hypothetical protein